MARRKVIQSCWRDASSFTARTFPSRGKSASTAARSDAAVRDQLPLLAPSSHAPAANWIRVARGEAKVKAKVNHRILRSTGGHSSSVRASCLSPGVLSARLGIPPPEALITARPIALQRAQPRLPILVHAGTLIGRRVTPFAAAIPLLSLHSFTSLRTLPRGSSSTCPSESAQLKEPTVVATSITSPAPDSRACRAWSSVVRGPGWQQGQAQLADSSEAAECDSNEGAVTERRAESVKGGEGQVVGGGSGGDGGEACAWELRQTAGGDVRDDVSTARSAESDARVGELNTADCLASAAAVEASAAATAGRGGEASGAVGFSSVATPVKGVAAASRMHRRRRGAWHNHSHFRLEDLLEGNLHSFIRVQSGSGTAVGILLASMLASYAANPYTTGGSSSIICRSGRSSSRSRGGRRDSSRERSSGTGRGVEREPGEVVAHGSYSQATSSTPPVLPAFSSHSPAFPAHSSPSASPPSVLLLCSPDSLQHVEQAEGGSGGNVVVLTPDQLMALLGSLPAHTAPTAPAAVSPPHESAAAVLPADAAVTIRAEVGTVDDASLREEPWPQHTMQHQQQVTQQQQHTMQQQQQVGHDVAALLSDVRVVVMDDVDGLMAATCHGDGCSSSSESSGIHCSSSASSSNALETILARISPQSTVHHQSSASAEHPRDVGSSPFQHSPSIIAFSSLPLDAMPVASSLLSEEASFAVSQPSSSSSESASSSSAQEVLEAMLGSPMQQLDLSQPLDAPQLFGSSRSSSAVRPSILSVSLLKAIHTSSLLSPSASSLSLTLLSDSTPHHYPLRPASLSTLLRPALLPPPAPQSQPPSSVFSDPLRVPSLLQSQVQSPTMSAVAVYSPPLAPSSLHHLLQALVAAGLQQQAHSLVSLALRPLSSAHAAVHEGRESRGDEGGEGRQGRTEAQLEAWMRFLLGFTNCASAPYGLPCQDSESYESTQNTPYGLPCPGSESLDFMLRAMARDGRDLFDLLRLVRQAHAAMDRAHSDVDRTHADMAEGDPAATVPGMGASSSHTPHPHSHVLSASAYSSLIRACVNGGHVREARRILRDMEKRGVPPSQAAVNIVAHMLFSQGDPDAALSLLHHVSAAHNMPMNAALLTTYVWGLGQAGRGRVQPNVRTWNALMHGYALKGDADAAEGVLRLMRGEERAVGEGYEEEVREGAVKGREPTGEWVGEYEEREYERRESGVWQGSGEEGGYSDKKHLDQHHWQECQQQQQPEYPSEHTGRFPWPSVRPNTVTYSTLMAAYATAGRSAEVWDVYKEMQTLSIPPNEFTFATLISSSAARSRPDLIESALADMAASQQCADVALVTSVLAAVVGCCGGRKEEAGRVLRWLLGEANSEGGVEGVESEGGVGEACVRLILEDGLSDAQVHHLIHHLLSQPSIPPSSSSSSPLASHSIHHTHSHSSPHSTRSQEVLAATLTDCLWTFGRHRRAALVLSAALQAGLMQGLGESSRGAQGETGIGRGGGMGRGRNSSSSTTTTSSSSSSNSIKRNFSTSSSESIDSSCSGSSSSSSSSSTGSEENVEKGSFPKGERQSMVEQKGAARHRGATELVQLDSDTWQLDVRRMSYGGAAVALNQWLVKLLHVVHCNETSRRQVASSIDSFQQWKRGLRHQSREHPRGATADQRAAQSRELKTEAEAEGPELLVQLAPAAAWQQVLVRVTGGGGGGRGQQHGGSGKLVAFGPDLVAWLRGPEAAAMLTLVDHDW
ncbi:hypothetical protein CLOP_g3183 [Closterium sp. NIES-67]|nr:hypothetical protein CLOP_g3183 [Closterium sp. NIES-67]